MHFLNPLSPTVAHPEICVTYVSKTLSECSTNHDPTDSVPLSYTTIPQSAKSQKMDERLRALGNWFITMQRPDNITDAAYTALLKYSMRFFAKDGHLWKKDAQGHHKVVIDPSKQLPMLAAAHNKLGHHGDYVTRSHLTNRFWWPDMPADIAWFVKTCHVCQLRQMHNILIPPVVATPAPLFAKMYMDTMHLPKSGGFKYLVQGRCSLTHFPEYRSLHTETGKTIGDWIFEDILCRWGTLCKIVTDNGPAFIKALGYLAKRYHIHHIHISGYNSRANSIAERAHFNVQQAMFKACNGDQSKWHLVVTSVMWADRITVCRRMGCSPYFAVTGTHPLLPLDIAEATYLLPPPDAPMSTTTLIANRAIALQKQRTHLANLATDVYAACIKAAVRFKQQHSVTITDYHFTLGDLVLIRNTAIEKSLSRKMHARYLGPLIMISCNKGGTYIIAKLDGAVFDRPIAAFRVIPYFTRQSIPIPLLEELIDVSAHRLRELEDSTSADPDEENEDTASDDDPTPDKDSDDED